MCRRDSFCLSLVSASTATGEPLKISLLGLLNMLLMYRNRRFVSGDLSLTDGSWPNFIFWIRLSGMMRCKLIKVHSPGTTIQTSKCSVHTETSSQCLCGVYNGFELALCVLQLFSFLWNQNLQVNSCLRINAKLTLKQMSLFRVTLLNFLKMIFWIFCNVSIKDNRCFVILSWMCNPKWDKVLNHGLYTNASD